MAQRGTCLFQGANTTDMGFLMVVDVTRPGPGSLRPLSLACSRSHLLMSPRGLPLHVHPHCLLL